MTDHTPPTDQQLDEYEARAKAGTVCPEAKINGREDGEHTWRGSLTHIRCELCGYTRPRGERSEETATLVAEVRRLRAELAPYEMLAPQQCPAGKHADWLVDSEYAHACPWCQIEELRTELVAANTHALNSAADKLDRIGHAAAAWILRDDASRPAAVAAVEAGE